jgi:hypothetical protein
MPGPGARDEDQEVAFRRRPDDPDTDAARETRAQVEAESNTVPRTLQDTDAPRSDAPETRAVPE